VDKAVLDDPGLRVHAHRLLVGRLVARDAMAALGDQILDQLSARGLVLDQHDAGVEQVLLLAQPAIDALVEIVRSMTGNDFAAEGRTLERLGLSGKDGPEIRRVVESGLT
jgi:hypothetical protein